MAPRFEFGDRVHGSITGITGIEVWNNFNRNAFSPETLRQFDLWDRLNASGRGHFFGNTVSDSHNAARCGTVFTKGYMERPSAGSVHHLLASGSYFGTNGPELRLQIDGKGIGEQVALGTGGEVEINLTAFDPLGKLEEVVLYRLHTGNTSGQSPCRHTILRECFAQGTHLYRTSLTLQAVPGDFYRAAAVSSCGVFERDRRGFAYTNPVWVV